MGQIELLPIRKRIQVSQIVLLPEVQPREELVLSVIDEYAEEMEAGADFEPVDVFTDQEHFWLADGFHRYHAAVKLKRERIDVYLRTGTLRDAVAGSRPGAPARLPRRVSLRRRCGRVPAAALASRTAQTRA